VIIYLFGSDETHVIGTTTGALQVDGTLTVSGTVTIDDVKTTTIFVDGTV